MLPELGHFALILALCLCVLLGTFPLYGAATGNVRYMGLARPLVAGVFVFIGLAYVLLTYSFAIDDFSVTYSAALEYSATFSLQTDCRLGRS